MRFFGLTSTAVAATPVISVTVPEKFIPSHNHCSESSTSKKMPPNFEVISNSHNKSSNNNVDDEVIEAIEVDESSSAIIESPPSPPSDDIQDILNIDLSEYRVSRLEIQNMRNKILSHLEDLGSDVEDYYNQCDIDWLLNPEKPHQIERFIISANVSEVDALDLICKCLLWRKEINLMSLTDTSFPSEFFSKGGLFRYQEDAAGTPMIYMRIKMIKKYPELDKHIKTFLAYQISRIDSASNDDLFSWAIVFDCTDIGFANVQIDMMKYLITVLKDYFPAGGKFSMRFR